MRPHHPDTTSPLRHGRRIPTQMAAVAAVAFALVAACVSAAPASLTPSPEIPSARAAADTCPAQMLKSGKLVNVYEKYYKYAYKKIKGSKKYRKVIVSAKRKVMVSCTRA